MHKSWNEKPPTFELIGKLIEIETRLDDLAVFKCFKVIFSLEYQSPIFIYV